MSELRDWASRWGDLASIAGVFLGVVGFVATIALAWRSKTAAEQARSAAIKTREAIGKYDALTELAAALALMDEIKRMQRHAVWHALPERYGELRRRVTAIKGSAAGLSDEQQQVLQGSIESFRDLERRVDRLVSVHSTPPNPAKLNDIVSSQIDAVHTVLHALRRSLEAQHD